MCSVHSWRTWLKVTPTQVWVEVHCCKARMFFSRVAANFVSRVAGGNAIPRAWRWHGAVKAPMFNSMDPRAWKRVDWPSGGSGQQHEGAGLQHAATARCRAGSMPARPHPPAHPPHPHRPTLPVRAHPRRPSPTCHCRYVDTVVLRLLLLIYVSPCPAMTVVTVILRALDSIP